MAPPKAAQDQADKHIEALVDAFGSSEIVNDAEKDSAQQQDASSGDQSQKQHAKQDEMPTAVNEGEVHTPSDNNDTTEPTTTSVTDEGDMFRIPPMRTYAERAAFIDRFDVHFSNALNTDPSALLDLEQSFPHGGAPGERAAAIASFKLFATLKYHEQLDKIIRRVGAALIDQVTAQLSTTTNEEERRGYADEIVAYSLMAQGIMPNVGNTGGEDGETGVGDNEAGGDEDEAGDAKGGGAGDESGIGGNKGGTAGDAKDTV